MAHLTHLGWHWRIRIKGSFWVYRAGKRRCRVNRIPLSAGQALCWHHVYLTKPWYGPVHLALGRPQGGQEAWVTQGRRRWVDAHWFRGQSYLKIGWNWVKLALSRGYELIPCLHLSAADDPASAMASKIQHQKPPQLFLTLEFEEAVA